MKSVVSEKGQVTIPKALRHKLGIEPGTVLDFEDNRDGSGFSDTEIIDSLASNQEEQDDEQEKTTAETDGEV